MRFTKIKKTKEDKIYLEYQEKNSHEEYDNFMMECADAPLPDFGRSLNALAPDIGTLCELPKNSWPRITAKSVSLSYSGEKEVMGAVISGAMELLNSNSPLNLNTPFKASGSYNDGDPDPRQVMEYQTKVRIEKLCDEAKRYLRGERLQGDLFKKDEAKEKTEKK